MHYKTWFDTVRSLSRAWSLSITSRCLVPSDRAALVVGGSTERSGPLTILAHRAAARRRRTNFSSNCGATVVISWCIIYGRGRRTERVVASVETSSGGFTLTTRSRQKMNFLTRYKQIGQREAHEKGKNETGVWLWHLLVWCGSRQSAHALLRSVPDRAFALHTTFIHRKRV